MHALYIHLRMVYNLSVRNEISNKLVIDKVLSAVKKAPDGKNKSKNFSVWMKLMFIEDRTTYVYL